jgi:hypothetical protein
MHCVSCADYHATRPYLMLSGARRGAHRDGEVFAGLLHRNLRDGGSMLIAGSADASMLEFVIDRLGSQLGQVAVADRCPSPLRACRRWADRRGIVIETHEADLTSVAPFGSYDLILAHLILGFLSLQGRLAYLALMRSMLRPGGRLIVVDRRGDPPGSALDRGRRVLDGLAALSVRLPESESVFLERLCAVLDRGQGQNGSELDSAP